MAGLDWTWQGMGGHDMASQGMQGVAHMVGSDHSYESSVHLDLQLSSSVKLPSPASECLYGTVQRSSLSRIVQPFSQDWQSCQFSFSSNVILGIVSTKSCNDSMIEELSP